jgi:hypothetical protein
MSGFDGSTLPLTSIELEQGLVCFLNKTNVRACAAPEREQADPPDCSQSVES